MARKLSERELWIRQQGFEAIHLMRSRGYSRRRAAREVGIDPRTLQKHYSSLLRRDASGRYRARSGDSMAAYMHYLTPEGVRIGAIRGSHNRSRLAEHAAAVEHFLVTGDYSRVRAFRGERIRIDGEWVVFLTDRRTLRQLGDAGEVSYDELYAYR